MATLRTLLVFIAAIFLAAGVTGFSQGVDTGSGSLAAMHTTADQTAVFMTFGASFFDAGIGPAGEDPGPDPVVVSTAMSISNPLGWNADLSPFLDLGGYVQEGTIEVFLWDQAEGELITFETSDDSIGVGLNEDGTLSPGQTWTFLLTEVLVAAGHIRDFRGFGWFVANHDGIVGSSTVVVFGVGFAQNSDLLPGVGQGIHGLAGLPIQTFDFMVDPLGQ